MRDRGLVDQGLHLVDQRGDALGAAHADLEQRLVPDRDEARHRLPQRGSAHTPARVEGRHAVQRRERELQRVALGPLRRLRHQRQPALGPAHASRGAEVQQRGFGRLGVIAQRGHRPPATVEVNRKLRRGHHRSCREQRARLAAEPVDVVVDDGRQIVGHRHRREPGLHVRAFVGANYRCGMRRRRGLLARAAGQHQ
ncbi:hypothetical protein [Piscinibacter sp.]|uniref:hypothetical protein n=1 Tax=Piscinibacter sp. TaxID=1903157 RepID=UPI002BD252D2|nr:hypothetical protein [Albitalea sp.]HUG24986.1 hypothetical protein [Albitalea sp.]